MKAILTVLASLVVLHSTHAAQPRPNLLFILADDLGWRDPGCYGSTFNETPHLDRLAREGLRFTQAYTAGAVCSPTRGSIMTGKVPVRTGVTDYIPGLPSTGRKLVTQRTRTELALEEVTVAEALKEGGYQTFYAGKWHLGGRGFEPADQGFEVEVPDAQLGNHGKDWRAGQRLTEAAIKFLDERDASRPFFMFLGYHEPHTPILEYPDHIATFRDKTAKLAATVTTRPEREGLTRVVQNDAAYGSEVAGLDAFVGRVLAKLETKNLAGSTIVIFFSDNGGLSTKADPGPTSNEPLRAGKGWLYEGGIRVPMIVRAPGITRAGATADTPVVSTDFYPTLLELAGLPARPAQHRDGISLVPVLRGGAGPQRDPFYWHYPHYHGSTWAPGGAMREGDWKLIEFFEEGTTELYDLKSDLSERRNLAAREPGRLQAMRAKLAAWRAETGAYVPQPGETPASNTPEAKKRRPKQAKE
jgi:arylsulfatase A-like enzyme